jgi:hypothetical protein
LQYTSWGGPSETLHPQISTEKLGHAPGRHVGLPSLSEAAQEALSPTRRPKLKITEIRTAEVRVHGYQVHVRIYTDQGIVGQGESTDAAQGSVPPWFEKV